MSTIYNRQKGFAAYFLTILVFLVMLGIATSLLFLTLSLGRISGNITRSTQSYFAAEAGIEDILLRLTKKKQWSSPYNLNVGSSLATIQISDIIGGSRTITSTGNLLNRIRKIQIVYKISTQQISFHYGAQVDRGGMEMGNNSRVQGNIYSNGNVIPAKGGEKGYVDNTVIVAINGNRIEGLIVG